jgi:hypothetical protein
MLFKKIIIVYNNNRMKYVNKNAALLILKIKVKFSRYAMQAQRGR